MRTTKVVYSLVVLTVLMSLSSQLSCLARDDHKRDPTSAGASGPMSLFLVDAPLDEIAHIWIHVEEAGVRSCAGGGWTSIAVGQTFDLLSLRSSISGQLANELTLPAGRYCELRLVLDSGAKLQLEDGTEAPITFPSSTASGIKIKAQFDVQPGVLTRITLDFDAEKSFSQKKHGAWKGHPVLKDPVIEYVAPSTSRFPGAELVSRKSFEVSPGSPSIWNIDDGATLSFPAGAVDSATTFTVTTWRPQSATYNGLVYQFEPSYSFSSPPILTKKVGPNEGGAAPRVFLDGMPLDTETVVPGALVKAAVPHFSHLCVDEAFDDVPATNRLFPYITFLRCRGIVQGKSDGTFDPEASLTRSELLKVVLEMSVGTRRILDLVGSFPDSFPLPFGDVPDNHWARDYIRYAFKVGLISGDGDDPTQFRPDAQVNRAEAAKMFVKGSALYQNAGRTGSAQNFGTLHSYFYVGYAQQATVTSPFTDAGKDDWFYEYALAMRAANAIRRNKSFWPAEMVPRKDMAQFAYLLASGFTELRLRLYCSPPIGPVSPGCIELLSTRAQLNQMYLEYSSINPTADLHHAGLDLDGSETVYSPVSGTVRRVTKETECGIVVIEDSRTKTDRHIFLHMKDIKVALDDKVEVGTLLGTSSASVGLGCAVSGPHLHYEIRKDKETIKPLPADDDPAKSTAEQTHNPLDFHYY